MTLDQAVIIAGPVVGVFLFMWANRKQQPSEKADPVMATVLRLDTIVEKLHDIHTDISVLKDRSQR